MNSILGHLYLLEQGGDSLTEEQREDVAVAIGSAKHLLALITDMLEHGRLQRPGTTFDFAMIDAAEVLLETAGMIEPRLHPDVELLVNIESNGTITADRGSVRQMLFHVLSNAAKFTVAGHVKVSLTWSSDTATFTVTDTGPGIPADDVERLFDSFYQSRSAIARTPRRHESIGLGLAISNAIAQQHGGDVRVKSRLGYGTTVSIHLPRTPALGRGGPSI